MSHNATSGVLIQASGNHLLNFPRQQYPYARPLLETVSVEIATQFTYMFLECTLLSFPPPD